MLDFRAKKIVVMGLGLNQGGLGVVQWLIKKGYPAIVTDLKSRSQLKETLRQLPASKLVTWRFGGHKLADFRIADIIIQNPGARNDSPYLKAAKRAVITNEAAIFFERVRARTIAVTGTRGKSTTAWLIYQLLKLNGRSVYLTGNIAQQPMLGVLERLKPTDWVVVELSSWQLEKFRTFKLRPQIAVLTNIYKDHLNRYRGFNDYIKAKQAVTVFQTAGDYLITSRSNQLCWQIAKQSQAKVIYFDKLKLNSRNFKLAGQHNLANLQAALTAAQLTGLPKSKLLKSLNRLRPLEFRQQDLGLIKGRRCINDTAATSPEAVLAALETFKNYSSLVLIAGGVDKKLDFKELAGAIPRRVSQLILFPGSASQKLKTELQKAQFSRWLMAGSMKEAVKLAFQSSQRGSLILLSPGAASFNLFKNEFDRGRQFNDCLKHERL